MDSEIICAMISVGGVIISAGIAWFTAKQKTAHDLEQMKLAWKHDTAATLDTAYDEMIAAVSAFLAQRTDESSARAIESVSYIRLRETDSLHQWVDALFNYLYMFPFHDSRNYQDAVNIRITLDKIIEEKRKGQSQR